MKVQIVFRSHDGASRVALADLIDRGLEQQKDQFLPAPWVNQILGGNGFYILSFALYAKYGPEPGTSRVFLEKLKDRQGDVRAILYELLGIDARFLEEIQARSQRMNLTVGQEVSELREPTLGIPRESDSCGCKHS
jgi:hypothetical protein